MGCVHVYMQVLCSYNSGRNMVKRINKLNEKRLLILWGLRVPI